MFRGIYRESPGIEVFYKCRTQTVDFKEGRTVAIKVLEGEFNFTFLKLNDGFSMFLNSNAGSILTMQCLRAATETKQI